MSAASFSFARVPFDETSIEPFGCLLTAHQPALPVGAIDVALLRRMVERHALVVLRDFATFDDASALSDYAARWGEPMSWPFGTVLELREQSDAADHIFDHSYVPLHWDGMYRPWIPKYQIFHCVQAPGEAHGGETTFCHTGRVLAHATPAQRARWEDVTVTYEIAKVSHYGGRVRSPLVTAHPEDRARRVMRYNEPPEPGVRFVNPHRVSFDGISADAQPTLIAELRESLRDRRHYYAHRWRTRDLVIADNYQLLHGREAYASRCARHLQRVHVLGAPPHANGALL